ncbi:MAG: hypothetical protein WCD18_09065 [Thermosynechococcaceae cyanobacterium]
MLIVMTEDHLLSPQTVCHNCLLADHHGLPRWQQGRLRCGQMIEEGHSPGDYRQSPRQFRCTMGFRLADVKD